MRNAANQHEPMNVNSLETQLTGFWKSYVWNMRQCPLVNDPEYKQLTTIHFLCLSNNIRTELRYGCWQRFILKKWSPYTKVTFDQIRKIIEYLNTLPRVASLMDRNLDEWILSLRTYLVEIGDYREYKGTWIDKDQNVREKNQGNKCLTVFRKIYEEVERAYDKRPEWERDIWDLRRVGILINPSKSQYRISFLRIKPVWLKEGVQKYLRMIVTTRSPSSCSTILSSLKKFGNFIDQYYPALQPPDITRKLLLEYAGHLAESQLKSAVRRDYLLDLAKFLEHAAREEWLPVLDRRMIYPEDLPPLEHHAPRFIPEFVMAQVDEHKHKLKPVFRRMLTVLIECGMRVGELCGIKLDCISQDAEGDFFLSYYQPKLKKDHRIPISKEAVLAIQEQINEVMSAGIENDYLFASNFGKPITQQTFSKKLHEFGHEYDIRDELGKLWRFQPHQMRHTVGCRMVNNKVPLLMIQRYLGHETPVMTTLYAHIHDQTLKKEFEAYSDRRGNLVNIAGKVIERTLPTDIGDLQWFKKNIAVQSLPNGYCALPLILSECPHANACLTCTHFRTDDSFLDQHRAHLAETTRLVQISRENNWGRQAEMNERVEKNLKNIINSLEQGEQKNG